MKMLFKFICIGARGLAIYSFLAISLLFGTSGVAFSAATGSLVAWGSSYYVPPDAPTELNNIKAISTSGMHSLALQADGTVAAWGWNAYSQTDVPPGLNSVKAVAAGGLHSIALKNDGTVVAWGHTYSGGPTEVPPGLNEVIAIAAGHVHSMALKSDGTVIAWGRNTDGQTNVPSGLANVKAIAAGSLHSMALKSDGTVVAWGYNNSNQVTVPAGLTDVKAIAAGGYHSLALKNDATVIGWGWNSYGQIDVPYGLDAGIKAIAGGSAHSIALLSNGTVVAWGNNSDGQTNVPFGLSGVTAIAAANSYSLALKGGYAFGGFMRPVDGSPIVNTIKAGAAVPLKFSLGGNQGPNIFADGFPATQTYPCQTGAITDAIEKVVAARGSGLSYNALTDIYTYVWKTDKAWAGQCQRLVLRFADGSEQVALFRYGK